MCGWLVQAVALVAIEGSLFSISWLISSLVFAAWALHGAIKMDQEATVACGVMALGCSVWHVRHDLPLSMTVVMAFAFMLPLLWRSWRVPA